MHPQESGELQDNRALVKEPAEAAELYQGFFDTPIVDGERQQIVHAVSSTWEGSQAEAALQAVDDRSVHLQRQEINVSEHGDWAEVEIYEVYLNRTGENQEVVYYFNLPEIGSPHRIVVGQQPRPGASLCLPGGAARRCPGNLSPGNRPPGGPGAAGADRPAPVPAAHLSHPVLSPGITITRPTAAP